LLAHDIGARIEMKRRVLIIAPLYMTQVDAAKVKNDLSRYAWDGTEIDVVGLKGNIAVNSRSEADIATPEFLTLVVKAEKDGYDAVVSYCYADVGVDAARELVKIPVIGPLEASAVVANMLGPKFSVVTVGTARSLIHPRLRELGLDSNYVSTRGIGFEKFFVFSADARRAKIMKDALMKECRRALSDGAQVLILGCTGFPVAEDMKEELKVPIIDGIVAVKIAEVLIDLKSSYGMSYTTGKQNPSEKTKPRKMRVKLIVPTSNSFGLQSIGKLKKIANEGTEMSAISFKEGPKSIKSMRDVAEVSPFITKEAANATRENFDAVIICSFVDPSLRSAREVCDIPVIGLGESSMLLACRLGSKFSILNHDKRVIPLIEKIARKLGVEKQLLSVKVISKEAKGEEKKLLEKVKQVIEEGAEAVIVDGDDTQEPILSIKSDVKVPLFEPLLTALKIAEALHSLKLSHSKLAYPKPALPAYHKERIEKLEEIPRDCMFLYGD
jgi:allantoin racemase